MYNTYEQAVAAVKKSAKFYPCEAVWIAPRRNGYVILNWPGISGKAVKFIGGNPV